MSAKAVRVGIIGCGVIAPAHIESFQEIDGVTVVWACDLVEEKAHKLADKYSIEKVTTDYRQVLADSDIDAISVCTDHASHAPISVDAMNAGKHILCEKALAANREGLDNISAAKSKNPGVVASGIFQHRFDKIHCLIKTLVTEGAFGTLLTGSVQVHCRRTPEYYRADKWRGTWAEEGGAVLINQAIHFIDELVWMMGGVEKLCGTFANITHNDCIETEDTATAAVRFKSGALGTIEATSSSHLGWESTISIHGSEGSLDLRAGKILKLSFADEQRGEEISKRFRDVEDEKTIEAGKSYYGASHPVQIADFVDSIREGREPYVTLGSARHTVDVVLAIYESWREGKWVDVGV